MQITSIVKKEYYDSLIVFDFNELSHIEYINDVAVLSFKGTGVVEIIRHEKDSNNDLKKIILDLYSSWKKYVENIQIITQVMEG